MAEQADFQKF